MKPSHRLQLTFTITEMPNFPINQQGLAWEKVDPPIVLTFDSDTALIHELPEYIEGHAPEQATGNVFYSYLSGPQWMDPRQALRVCWFEVTNKKVLAISGAVLNESMEWPIGHVRGQLEIVIGAGEAGSSPMWTEVIEGVTLSDENGCHFRMGAPILWIDYPRFRWYSQRFRQTSSPPSYLFAAQPCPDARGGNAWQSQWTPYNVNLKKADGSWMTPKYWATDDPRNPPIGAMIGDSKVADWYLRQTHGHYREGGEGFRSPWETGLQAALRAENHELVREILSSLSDYVAAQVGGQSPTGQGYIDGRPNHLSLLNGELFRAGQKYNLNPVDQAAPYPAVLQEGRPGIGKSGWIFSEAFGREKLHWVEITASQYKGLYQLPNGSDYEHCATGPLVAAAILSADPLAQRQLHHICEEHVSKQDVSLHSTRSDSGWELADLADGYIAFVGNSKFGPDAVRYREAAWKIATKVWGVRFDQTPYRGLLTVGFEYMNQKDAEGHPLPEYLKQGYEATMQLAIALHAATVWYQIEHESGRKAFWLALVKYIGLECLDQPGIIDWSRGGTIPRYSLQTPIWKPGDPGSASELVEQHADPKNNKREILADEGWVVPALAEAWLATQIDRFHDMALEGYRVQQTKIVGPNQETIYSPTNWSAWGQNYPCRLAFEGRT